MKYRLLIVLAAIVAVSVPIATEVFSQEDPGVDHAEMMKKWQAVATPGKHHEIFKKFDGEWNTSTKVWMGGPGTKPMETKGTATYKTIMGGRFLKSDTEGSFMGKAMNGLGITGYDNFKKLYTMFWIDSQGTAMYFAQGTRKPGSNVIHLFGTMDEPTLDMVGRTVRYSLNIVDDNKHVFEIYDLASGLDYKVLEITYTRKKGS